MRKQIWIGLVIAVFFGYFAFRGISFREIGHALSQANLTIIGIAVLLYIADFLIRTVRWSIIIKPLKPVGPFEMVWVLLLGFFANNVLPFRMGEIARAHFCAQKTGISRSSAFGTIVMERLCDMVSFLFVFLIASTAVPFPAYMKKGALLMGSACLLAILALLFAHFKKQAFESILRRIPVPDSWKGKLMEMVNQFTHSTIGILRVGLLVKALCLSAVVWTAEAGFLFLIAKSLAVPLPFMGAFFLLFALGLSVALPQGPGYVGTYEYFGTTALAFLGIPKEQGLPMILAVHGLQFVLIALFGMFSLWKEGLSFRTLSSTR